jgi:hypothetical protein
MNVRTCFLATVLSLSLLTLGGPLSAATLTWTGAIGGVWSNAANWGGTAPTDGDDLVFPFINGQGLSINDLAAGTSFHSITILGSYDLRGNAITVTDGGITDGPFSAQKTIRLPIALGASQVWTTTAGMGFLGSIDVGGYSLTLTPIAGGFGFNGPIIGTGALTLNGGTVGLNNTNNPYSGTLTNNGSYLTVIDLPAASYTQSSGTLSVSKDAGDVTINGGDFAPDPQASFSGGIRLRNLTLGPNATFRLMRTSPCFCTFFFSLTTVTGTVNLGGAALFLEEGAGTSIIEDDGPNPVVGTFAGLPEGATVVASTHYLYRITYSGGDGDDVAISPTTAPSTTTLTASPNPSAPSETVMFSAQVDTIGPAVGATVSFFDDGTLLGTEPSENPGVSNLFAFSTSSLSVGSHMITAEFSGDVSRQPSTSPVLIQVVRTPLPPEVTFTAEPSSITRRGTSTLTWTTTDATAVAIDGDVGVQPLSGSVVVEPVATTTYTLTATGDGGTTMRQATVTVTSGPSIIFIASPDTILPEQSSTLTWSTQNATSIVIDHGIGTVDAAGMKVVAPLVTTTYVITATGSGGTQTASVTVKVIAIRGRAVRH